MTSEMPRPEAKVVLVKRHSESLISENFFVHTIGKSHPEDCESDCVDNEEEAAVASLLALAREDAVEGNAIDFDGNAE